MDILHKLELLPTKREGIFVMPVDRITIVNTYWYRAHGPLHLSLEGPAASESLKGVLSVNGVHEGDFNVT